jgi:lanosterol synthase
MAKRKSNDTATGAEVVPNGGAGKMKMRNPEVQQNGNAEQNGKPDENGKVQPNGTGATHPAKRPRLEERTDYTRWRMRDDESRHTWHYLEDDEAMKEWPQTLADKYYLGLPLVRYPATLLPLHFLR